MPDCHECGEPFSIDDNGVATHDTPDEKYSPDGIDHDTDLDHVPFSLDDDEDDYTPDEEDGFIFGNAEASFAHKYLGSFEDEEAARQAVRDAGNASNFWPNVWWVSDHGNQHLIRDFWSPKEDA